MRKYELRLRSIRLPEDLHDAKSWYQDRDVMYFSEGVKNKSYSMDTIKRMYTYLQSIGEVYIIEVKEDGKYIAIGDATLSKQTLPIVIGVPEYRSKGIGSDILNLLIAKAREKHWDHLLVKGIYDYNERSIRLYSQAGFEHINTYIDDSGNRCYSYKLDL